MKYNDIRRKSNEVKIGNVKIGAQNPIAIQTMTNTDTLDADATVALSFSRFYPPYTPMASTLSGAADALFAVFVKSYRVVKLIYLSV